jgi:carboxypeptidase family protein
MIRSTYLVAALVVAAVPSAAQDSTPGSTRKADSVAKAPQAANTVSTRKADSTAKAPAAANTVQPRHTLSQFVLFSNGQPARGATVVVTPAGASQGPPRARGAITDSVGRFTIDSLPSGLYNLQVMHQGMRTPAAKQVTVDGQSVGDIVIRSGEPSAWWTVLILLLYLLSIMAVRWHSIARSLDEMLKGQLSALSTRLDLEVKNPDPTNNVKTALQATIRGIQEQFGGGPGDKPWRLKFSFAEFFFWSRGRENAAWVAIHEVERQLAAYLTPPERVVSYLHLAHAQLRVINSPPAIAIADAIRAWLPSQPNEPTTPEQDEHRRALLGRAIALANEERDKQFSTLMEWHNKASWLILAALIIIGFLALAAGNAVLFLAGAAGGFLSRVMRALRREDLPLDYGASWTTLFLSPLFGALAAWFGIALITLATQPSVNLLGDAFRLVDWNTPTAPATLAVAFLLGFSERLFDAVVGAVERHAAGTKAAEEAAKAASAAAPVIPQRAAAGDAAATSNGTKTAAAAGPKIVLEHGPLPVGLVSGKVLLDKPVTTVTGVNLSTSRPDFIPTPAALSIPAGELEGEFDIVPKGNATGGSVGVTARVGNVKVNDTIEFV